MGRRFTRLKRQDRRHPRVMRLLKARHGDQVIAAVAARRRDPVTGEATGLTLVQTIAEMVRDIRFGQQITRIGDAR